MLQQQMRFGGANLDTIPFVFQTRPSISAGRVDGLSVEKITKRMAMRSSFWLNHSLQAALTQTRPAPLFLRGLIRISTDGEAIQLVVFER